MRVGVGNPFQLQQCAQLVQAVGNGLVGVIDVLALQPVPGILHHAAVLIDVAISRQAVFLTDKEVVRTEARSRMNTAGAGVGGDVIAQDD